MKGDPVLKAVQGEMPGEDRTLSPAVPLWEFVPVGEHARPSEPPSVAARSGLMEMLKRLRGPSAPAEPVSIHAELHSVPQELLDAVVPVPEWSEAVLGLDNALEEWLEEDDQDYPARVILGAPGSGTGQILSSWADKWGWTVVTPPAIKAILHGDAEGGEFLSKAVGKGLVIPAMERLFLRHHRGLAMFREFLECLWEKRSRCLLGCDSWAWAFLEKVASTHLFFRSPLVLQAFDQERMGRWFRALAACCGRRIVIFRQSDTGEVILSTEETVDITEGDSRTGEDSGNGKEEGGYLARIAARSRGIPLVAWAIWRNSLLISAEEPVADEVQKAAERDKGLTIWVKPWGTVEFPEVPPDITRAEQFLLHALLIHGGLLTETISMILPLSPADATRCLTRMSSSGLIKQEEGIWRVTLSGYPAVRQYLQNEDYLVDAL